eukprot:scaffold143904_cov24-Tisochrysis_lutea.AAC.1
MASSNFIYMNVRKEEPHTAMCAHKIDICTPVKGSSAHRSFCHTYNKAGQQVSPGPASSACIDQDTNEQAVFEIFECFLVRAKERKNVHSSENMRWQHSLKETKLSMSVCEQCNIQPKNKGLCP